MPKVRQLRNWSYILTWKELSIWNVNWYAHLMKFTYYESPKWQLRVYNRNTQQVVYQYTRKR